MKVEVKRSLLTWKNIHPNANVRAGTYNKFIRILINQDANQTMYKKFLPVLFIVLWANGVAAEMKLSTGLDYSEGKYGSTIKTSQWTLPLVARYESENWSAKLSLPYVHIKNVNPGAGGEALPCGAALTTPKNVSGFGDLVASGSYTVYQDNGYLIDLGSRVKFATGDTKKCLSSGKNDYSAQIDIAKKLEQWTVFGTAGWTKKGDPDFAGVAVDYRNPFFYTVGSSYNFGNGVSAGASYDYRQRLISTGDPISELTLFVTLKQSSRFKIQSYVVTGFSNASVDRGIGIVATYGF